MRTNDLAEDERIVGAASRAEQLRGRGAAALRTELSSKLRTIALACLLILTAGCSAGTTLESVLKPDGADATVEDIRIFRNGTPVTPALSMRLEAGDEIQTEADSTAIIRFGDGTEIIVGPNTHVRIGSLWVLFGEIYVKARGRFRVETLYVTAGVEGTQYLLTVDRKAEMSMVVLDGAVRLTSKTGSWEPVALKKLDHGVFRPQETPLMSRVDPAQGNRIMQAINQPVPRILAPASPAAAPGARSPGIELGPRPAVQPPAAGPGLAPTGNLPAPGPGLPAQGVEVPGSRIPQGPMAPGGVEVPGSRMPQGPIYTNPTPIQTPAVPPSTIMVPKPPPTSIFTKPTPVPIPAVPPSTIMVPKPPPTSIFTKPTPVPIPAVPPSTIMVPKPPPTSIFTKPTPVPIPAVPPSTIVVPKPPPTSIFTKPTPVPIPAPTLQKVPSAGVQGFRQQLLQQPPPSPR